MFKNKIYLAVAVAAVVVAGCWEADPDQDSFSELKATVFTWPVELKDVMARLAANRVAYGYLLSRHDKDDDHLATIRCVKDDKPHYTDPTIDVQVTEMLTCLTSNGTSTYVDCLNMILEDIVDQYPDRQCTYIGHRTGLAPDEIPDEFKADRNDLESIAQALLGPPPPLDVQLMLMGLPGMMGPAGALCPQGVDWACAPSPFDGTPSATSSAASGGGDR